MKLEDFIELTLKEVISGVTAAQAAVAETEARINPPCVRARGTQASGFYEMRENRPASFLEFDISVTTVEGEKGKVGAGVFVGPLALGECRENRRPLLAVLVASSSLSPYCSRCR